MNYIHMFKYYWQYTKGYHIRLLVMLFAYTLVNILNAFAPLIFAQILNAIQSKSGDILIAEITFWSKI